jgi:hypothetical protein
MRRGHGGVLNAHIYRAITFLRWLNVWEAYEKYFPVQVVKENIFSVVVGAMRGSCYPALSQIFLQDRVERIKTFVAFKKCT